MFLCSPNVVGRLVGACVRRDRKGTREIRVIADLCTFQSNKWGLIFGEVEPGERQVGNVNLEEHGLWELQLAGPIRQDRVHGKVQILLVCHMDHGIPGLNVVLGKLIPVVPPSLGPL